LAENLYALPRLALISFPFFYFVAEVFLAVLAVNIAPL
jgi:hypothetical protein